MGCNSFVLNQFLFQILILISRLPLKVLYLFSDVMFFFSYHLVGYRKKIVLENLSNSFPHKTKEEIKSIRRKFFVNFSDYIIETLKAFTVSETELKVRVQHINQELFHQAKAEGKNIIMLSGHVFNWEWINAFATLIPQEHSFPVYRDLQNKFWDKKIRDMRSRFGNQAIDAREVIKHIFRNPNDGNSCYMFVADQTPQSYLVNYGLDFLNQKTPAFIGYDKLATRLDLFIIYCEMKKVKRGYYQVNYHRITPDGEKFEDFEVVKKFHRLLEETIIKRPDNWLWSHRRWKYQYAIKNYDGNL